MTPRKPRKEPTTLDRFGVTPDELTQIFGDDWPTLTHDQAHTTLHDTLAHLTAEHDQAEALIADLNAFTFTFIVAVVLTGTRHLAELCDNVNADLGGETEGSRLARISIAGLLHADEQDTTRLGAAAAPNRPTTP
jgi:hypothetical protein